MFSSRLHGGHIFWALDIIIIIKSSTMVSFIKNKAKNWLRQGEPKGNYGRKNIFANFVICIIIFYLKHVNSILVPVNTCYRILKKSNKIIQRYFRTDIIFRRSKKECSCFKSAIKFLYLLWCLWGPLNTYHQDYLEADGSSHYL